MEYVNKYGKPIEVGSPLWKCLEAIRMCELESDLPKYLNESELFICLLMEETSNAMLLKWGDRETKT